EPTTQLHAQRPPLAGAVERPGDVRPPVHDHRVAALVGDVPAADVEPLTTPVRVVLGVVETAEEQRDLRVVLALSHRQPDGGLEHLLRDPVARGAAIERSGALPHPGQARPGGLEVTAFELDGAGRHDTSCRWAGKRATTRTYPVPFLAASGFPGGVSAGTLS